MPYNFKRESDPTGYITNPALTIPVGDLCYWNATQVESMSASTDGAMFVGVAMGQLPIASNIDNVPGLDDQMLIKTTGIFLFNTTSGDALAHGSPLVRGADSHTVLLRTAEPLTDVIGYAWLPTKAGFTSTGAEQVEVKIRANYPDPYLAS